MDFQGLNPTSTVSWLAIDQKEDMLWDFKFKVNSKLHLLLLPSLCCYFFLIQ